jgi:N-sulfoglucosamine sulfohydrolase
VSKGRLLLHFILKLIIRGSFMSKVILLFLTLSLLFCNSLLAQEKPNILWLTSEDNNITYIGCYGNEMAKTPNIDKLAQEGFRYLHCYSNGAVCSTQRSSWIMGMNAISAGTQNHRSKYRIPEFIQLYPTVLKKMGYYTGNSTKTDYSLTQNAMKGMWDNPRKVNWDELKKNQPFFQVINSTESHESRAMGIDHKHDPAQVKVAPYHPDTPGVRANYAHYYDAITRMDAEIGASLKKLEELGLAENTIVIYNSDHGGALPRGKRYMYNSGTHCPLVIRIPEKYKHLWPNEKVGTTVERLVSYIDMPATWLSLVGAKRPKEYQGRVFLGKEKEPEAQYHFSFRGRNDARVENARGLRTKQFLMVKNYIPYVPMGQYLSYQWRIPLQVYWEEEHKAGRTNAVTGRFFQKKAVEELYDTSKDPYNTNNLINHPEYAQVAKTLRQELVSQQKGHFDAGLLPESEMSRLAKDNNTTIYEVAHTQKLYDVAAYLQVSEMALQKNIDNIPAFITGLKSQDSGVRYWAAVGCFLLEGQAGEAKSTLLAVLDDKDSDCTRLMAAWALTKMGENKAGDNTINNLLNENSYAMLEILNAIAWMGDYGKRFTPAIEKTSINHEMKDILVLGRAKAMAKMNASKKRGKKKKK